MLLLTSATDKIQLVTSAAVACHVHADWVDIDGSGTVTPGRKNTIISTAATTDIVPSPASGTTRNIKRVVINAIGGANNLILQHTDGTTLVQLYDVPLLAGEHINSVDGEIQVLDASGAVKLASTPQGGRLIKTTVYTSGSGNHTTDPKTSMVKMRLVGGGGGGGGGASAASSGATGAGGGSGAYLEKTVAVSPSTAYAYAVGIAGTAGANTGGTGGTGGSTTLTVGATTYTAAGGVGGVGQAAGTTAAVTAGGAGGAATNGDLNMPGNVGFSGNRQSGTAGWSGDGADSKFGGGGPGKYAAAAGAAATGYGAGGGGALVLNASAAAVGGLGSAGLIVIEEYT